MSGKLLIAGRAVGVDLHRWPVIVIDTTTVASDQAMGAQIAFLRQIYAECPLPYATVIDVGHGKPPTPVQRAMLSAFRQEVREHVMAHCRGIGFVFDNPLLRGMMTAIFWVRPPDAPTDVFARLEDAVGWCRGKLVPAHQAMR